MVLKVYNTLTNSKEEFKPIEEGKVGMYVCGQTVYDNMHIGHGRTYIAFDIIRRYLQYRGYEVKTVINITDVNDKIDNRADEEGKEPEEIAEKYARINLEDFKKLGIRAEAFPRASEYIGEMKELVQRLVEKGFAYESEGNVFFDVKKFEDYGKLSNQDLDDLKSERDDIKDREAKKDPRDFVLWRARKDYEHETYESPWGEGVPGWHIECSAMSSKLLGDKFDIHGGGVDLVFPHHEDEIAQSEAASGERPWVKYWMHSGLVRLKDEKMSKSLGNFISTREFLEKHEPEVLRLLVASTHYRKPLDYSEERIEQAEKNYSMLENSFRRIESELRASDTVPSKLEEEDEKFIERVKKLKRDFEKAMDDDFNTPEAVKVLMEISRSINSYLDSESPKRTVIEQARDIFEHLSWVLGVNPGSERADEGVGRLVEKILEKRKDARRDGNYELADELREILEESGINVEDTEKGVRWSMD